MLAGLAVFEREIHWFTQDLDLIQSQHFPDKAEPVHFHASQLRARQGQGVPEPWDRFSVEERRGVKNQVYSVIRARQGVLFGCAVEKRFAEIHQEDSYERALEDVVKRFDLFMSRVNRIAMQEGKEEQRGLLVLAESRYERTISLLARRLHEKGTRWGQLHNVTDIPYFAPAKDTRMLQYADFCANAIYGRYHAGFARDFDAIAPKFDQDGSVLHGLVHLTTDLLCACVACFSRRGRQQPLPLSAPLAPTAP